MTARYDIAALKGRLEGIRTEDNPALVRQKSRDFYWYSPILKRQLDQVTADVVVSPTSEAEVVRTLAAAFELGIPVTPRGTGTGNYGQAMPLSGGIVLDLSGFDAVKHIAPGRIVAEPGAVIAAIDRLTRPHSAQEIRLHPSTYNTASIGGFVAGGSGGVGSIKWGGLRDAGNIIRLKIVTMEKTPRVLELAGEELHKVAHAYGTNGIITEVEMPLAPAYDWIDLVLGFDTLAAAASYANALGEEDGLLIKQLAVIAAPVPHDVFLRHRKYLPRDKHLALAMVAPHALDALLAFTRRFRNAEVLLRQDQMSETDLKGLPPVFELSWNHTTLRALRVDPTFTYLQTLYPFPNQLDLVERIHARFGDEVPAHLEFVRFDGKVTCFGLPLVRFTTEERLEEIIAIHEEMGSPVFNPHRYTLEEGGMKRTDSVQLAFKREADPQGLLNPGKMIAWEDPAYDYRTGKTFLFRGLAQDAAE
jgi:FAD/FMN-containing dehydrogenase